MSLIAEPGTSRIERKKFKGQIYMERIKKKKNIVVSQPSSEKTLDDSGPEEIICERDTDEDTEDASETEVCKQEEEFNEKKEQLFLEKIALLRKQLQQVADGCHPEYQRRLRKIELIHHERNLFNEVWRQCEIDRVQADSDAERNTAQAELQEKTLELQEGLIAEYEEKRRHVELERNVVELTGDSLEVKTASTRKLRRRPNDPVQPLTQEKRRKVSPSQLNLLLDEAEILEDLKLIQRGKVVQNRRGDYETDPTDVGNPAAPVMFQDAKIEHNKLFYDKKWHHRGQCVHVESREHGRFSGTIETIGTSEISVKKVPDGSRVRVTLATLQRGKVLKKRCCRFSWNLLIAPDYTLQFVGGREREVPPLIRFAGRAREDEDPSCHRTWVCSNIW